MTNIYVKFYFVVMFLIGCSGKNKPLKEFCIHLRSVHSKRDGNVRGVYAKLRPTYWLVNKILSQPYTLQDTLIKLHNTSVSHGDAVLIVVWSLKIANKTHTETCKANILQDKDLLDYILSPLCDNYEYEGISLLAINATDWI